MGSEIIVVIVVATALIFDFTNGFHDTANVVATSISTRAMPPRVAVGYAAILNFVGAFISLAVAATVAQDVVEIQPNSIGLIAVFSGLVGAIAWNLITWYFGLPSSSSHALIGGMVGAVFVAEGADAVFFKEGILGKVMIPAVVAPLLAFIVGGLAILFLYRIVGRLRPGPVTAGFRFGQIISGGLLALAHGTNDAQKTMGVITLALVANGFPLSTTHTITGAVIGSGAAKRLSAVRWGVAGNIVVAWILTLPMAAVFGGLTYLVTRVFGTGAIGPIVVSTACVVAAVLLYARRSLQAGVPPGVPGS
jgi:PiT family inorganic phosphate transporter